MTMDAPPFPPQAPPPPRASNAHVVLIVWAGIGLFFTVVQFAISEIAFRMGERTGIEVFYDVSDTVAWPAGLLYDLAESRKIRGELEALRATPAIDSEMRQEIGVLLALGDDEKFWDAFWDSPLYHQVEGELGLRMEYLIYGGVCVGWGVLLASAGMVLTLLARNRAGEPGF